MEGASLLEQVLKGRKLITYVPLRTEVSVERFVSILPSYTIQPRPTLDPKVEALSALKEVGNTPAAVLMPGRRFDTTGTRHGQGGGWYDRFLARVPTEWLRIGLCYSDQLSPTLLIRHEWDQPMDYVCVEDRDTGELTVYASGRLGT